MLCPVLIMCARVYAFVFVHVSVYVSVDVSACIPDILVLLCMIAVAKTFSSTPKNLGVKTASFAALRVDLSLNGLPNEQVL